MSNDRREKMNDQTPPEAEQRLTESEVIDQRASRGAVVTVDPEIADYMGAFEETALDPETANESRFDVDLETGIALGDPAQEIAEGGSSNE
jgi:hypothetical protein